MGLTKAQNILLTKARHPGGSELGVYLDDEICTYLIAVIISNLGLSEYFPDLPVNIPAFFAPQNAEGQRVRGYNFLLLFEKLLNVRQDADTYFYCLATLHKTRLKYERILQAQPIPTIDQVGPRGL